MNTLKNLLMSDKPVDELFRMVDDNTLRDFEPSLADLRMPIPHGVHHKDNLVHSIKVLDNAIARENDGADLILRTAALFHDIGKPATRKFQGRKTVTFDNHEYVGANMLSKILRRHGYTKNEIRQVSIIVRHHMRSHGFDKGNWTDSAVRRLMNDVGDKDLLQKLIIVFYADATSANKNTIRKHHASVDYLKTEIARVQSEDARKALRPAINGNEVMEMFNLRPGPELGKIMKFLNTDDGIALSKDEAIDYIRKNF